MTVLASSCIIVFPRYFQVVCINNKEIIQSTFNNWFQVDYIQYIWWLICLQIKTIIYYKCTIIIIHSYNHLSGLWLIFMIMNTVIMWEQLLPTDLFLLTFTSSALGLTALTWTRGQPEPHANSQSSAAESLFIIPVLSKDHLLLVFAFH